MGKSPAIFENLTLRAKNRVRHVIYVTSSLMVSDRANRDLGYVLLCWGANSYGQLCNGSCEDILSPNYCKMTEEVVKDIQSIAGGGGHTVIITRSGAVYVCGWNGNGQLGVGHVNNVDVPIPISGLQQQIVKVACGWNHTMAITNLGELYAWGSNSFGQLGMPQVQRQVGIPKKISPEIFASYPVVDIGAGMRHSAAITVDHKMYTWGTAKRGLLGLGKIQDKIVNIPTVVTSFSSDVQPIKVVLGSYHTLILTAAGTVYACGCNEHGQCGIAPVDQSTELTDKLKCDGLDSACTIVDSHDPHYIIAEDSRWVKCVLTPHLITGLRSPVKQISSGWCHCMAITRDGRVFMWGRCDYGQLGLPGWCQSSGHRCCWQPTELPQLHNAKKALCGSEHNIAVDANGCLLSWGWNEHGTCGSGGQQNIMLPSHVKLLQDGSSPAPLVIAAGAGTSFALIHQHTPTQLT